MRPPKRCATRTTRVRGVKAASSTQDRGVSVQGSMSTGTARRPCSLMIRTMSGCVTAETRTSSLPTDPAHQATGPTHSAPRNKPALLPPKSTAARPHLQLLPLQPPAMPKNAECNILHRDVQPVPRVHSTPPPRQPAPRNPSATPSNPQCLIPSLLPHLSYIVSLHCKAIWRHTAIGFQPLVCGVLAY